MKRRHFLTLSALATPLAGAAAASPKEDWSELVETTSQFTAKAEEGDLTLTVTLEVPGEVELIERAHGENEAPTWELNGEILPERFWPGCSLIKKFDFRWNGKPLVIEKRFWRDLAGFTIETIPKKPVLRDEEGGQYEDFIARLRQPRVILSAEGGTALIEWERSEECDSSSTIRWIVSRSGTVLRHRHTPPHEC